MEVFCEVFGGGSVAGLAGDIGEGCGAEGAAVSAGFAEADGMAFDAVWIGIGAGTDEGLEGAGVA